MAALKTTRPILPNPFIPIFILIIPPNQIFDNHLPVFISIVFAVYRLRKTKTNIPAPYHYLRAQFYVHITHKNTNYF